MVALSMMMAFFIRLLINIVCGLNNAHGNIRQASKLRNLLKKLACFEAGGLVSLEQPKSDCR